MGADRQQRNVKKTAHARHHRDGAQRLEDDSEPPSGDPREFQHNVDFLKASANYHWGYLRMRKFRIPTWKYFILTNRHLNGRNASRPHCIPLQTKGPYRRTFCIFSPYRNTRDGYPEGILLLIVFCIFLFFVRVSVFYHYTP